MNLPKGLLCAVPFSLEISHGSPDRYDGLHRSNTLAWPWQYFAPTTIPQSLDIWLQAAGMDWTIEQSDVMFNVASDALHIRPYSDSKVLYRSDTLPPMSVVSSRYNVVQPHEVPHFYQDLVEARSFELEKAGELNGITA